MLYQALVVGLVMALGVYSDKGLGDPMLRRPLVMGPIVGLLLGNLEKGVIVGAAIEVVFLGTTQIGGALPSDSMTGSIFGTAFAIITNQSTQIALTLAIPISILAVFLNQLTLFAVGLLEEKFKQLINKENYHAFVLLHYSMIAFQCIVYFLVGMVGILAGTHAIQHILNIIPAVLMNGLNLAGKLLPALGIALLLNMLWDSKLSVFVLFGFVLSAYLKLPLIAIACLGLVISVTIALQENKFSTEIKKVGNNTSNNGDDFFD
ncbi:PTS mannose/fructose/sorbose/N-acetylgalactosamine transporter subunit IIC [Bombilactobacillus bombi]|uniref:PTS mannose/fructose/sorbose/N-acetylgalactosamine transporter subunit IIC n=1 Tax=Bombilactobacillus bombi TaxID=1303590 RepID=UPI0015E5A78C|nr:PTS sugar transporter subunit IIC [Bombilactobacillus bombi]MBA1434064.1 PTS sugar transporter subunit IIC [Bombilactobacillus bombi]